MIVLNAFGGHFYNELSPIMAIISMIGLLVVLLTISKLFFWLVFDMKSPVEKKIVTKQLYATPDVLMQVKNVSSEIEIQEINNLAPNMQNTKSLWLKFVAVTLAVILCFTQSGDLLSPYKDYFFFY